MHRLWPIPPALLAIAIGDKDFIVSPSNRKTDERARFNGTNGTNGREGETKKNNRGRKNRNGGGDKASNAQRMRIFQARLHACGREKCTTRKVS